MFVDLRTLEHEQKFEFDLCIVGSGPAGISIARQFVDSGLKVCLVESGDVVPKAENQDLADGEMASHPHHKLRTSRDRQFGGCSNSWAGACAPMSASDFEPRPWAGLEGWPFAIQDLQPYYRRAQALFEIGPPNYDPDHWAGDGIAFLDLDSSKLENRIWQLSPRLNFGKAHHAAFDAAANVTVLLNATVTGLFATSSANLVKSIEVRSIDDKTITVKASAFVLACGAIDNARLLLLSQEQSPDGLGNRYDQVGRCFMQHPHVSAASLSFSGSKRWLKSYKDFNRDGIWLRARIGLSKAAQERHAVLNPVASVINRFITDSLTHAQSIGYVALKHILLDLRHRRVPANFWNEIRNVISDTRGIATGFLRHLRDQNGALYVMSEQFPNPDSRVTLSADRDRFGLPKARVDWRLLPLDKLSIRYLVQELQEEFERLHLGEIVPDAWLTQDDHSWPHTLAGGHHHMGTTRMSKSPRDGVVDADARVHGIDNLYVAGSSIFPTVGSANPTLTLVATSLKLADHLKAKLAKPLSAAAAS